MAETAEPEKLVELEKVAVLEVGEPLKEEEAPPEAPAPPPEPAPPMDTCFVVDVALRVLFFAATVTAVVVMVTSNQTKVVPGLGGSAPVEAKFNDSPALVYFVAALSVACLYSIITALASISVILTPIFATSFKFFFLLSDVVMLGIVASATGTAGTVAYIGLKGNSHTNWGKVCNVYDKFCRHIGSATAVSLFAAVVLVFLIALSVFSIHKKIPK